MIYLLDTNILIYLIKKRPESVIRKVSQLGSDDVLSMSFVTWAELLKGAERSTRKSETLARLDMLARQISLLYPRDAGICRHYAEQFTLLRDSGMPIGANDLWIACHALAEGATLVTHNLREFERIRGLPVEDWVTED